MDVIPAVADEVLATGGIGARLFFTPKPGVVRFGTLGFGAAVFVFEFERNRAKKTGSTFANVSCQKEGADVLADAVVEVGVPALGLLLYGLPADENVERGFAFENGGQFGLKDAGSSKALGSSRLIGLGVVGLLLDPVAEVAVGELLQSRVVEAVVVDQGVEAIGTAVPQVPDKRAVMEEFGVLLEKLVAKPVFEGFRFTAFEPGGGDEGTFVEGAESGGEKPAKAGCSRLIGGRQTMPSSSAKDSSPSGPRAGQSGKLLPVWRGQR